MAIRPALETDNSVDAITSSLSLRELRFQTERRWNATETSCVNTHS
jgi:hypothetical protein